MKTAWIAAAAALAAGIALGLAHDHVLTHHLVVENCPQGHERMARLELLFGATRPDGGAVSDAEWKAFLDEEVTPRFPDGLTVLRGYGQWRQEEGAGISKEASIVLVIWHPLEADRSDDIDAIREAYKARFDQQSVMRVGSTSCVSF